MSSESPAATLSAYPFQITLPARFTDIDGTGQIGHIGMARYYEDVRSSFMNQIVKSFLGDRKAWRGFAGRVSGQQFAYPQYPHPLSFGAGVASIGSRSYAIELAAFSQGVCIGRSRSISVLVADDLGTSAVDGDLRALLSRSLLQQAYFPVATKPGPERQRLDYYAHRIEFPTRFSDTDAIGHINNVAHLRYADEGRAAILVEAAQSTDARALGSVSSFDVSYLREGKSFVPIVVATSVASIQAGSVHLMQGLFQQQHCVSTCDWEVKIPEDSARHSRFEEALRGYSLPT